MNTEVSISVVIPTHNRQKLLTRAINSVLDQTKHPAEIIVIDDGSDEEFTKEKLGISNTDIPLKIIRHEKPKGANAARNRGVNEAKGTWIAFLDDDDEFFPKKIEMIYRLIKHVDRNNDLIYHPAKIFMINEGVDYRSSTRAFGEKEDIFKSLLLSNHIGGTSMTTIKRKTLQRIGGFDESLPALQDYELWLRMAKEGLGFAYLEHALTKYRHITGSGSITSSTKVRNVAMDMIKEKYEDDFSQLTDADKKALKARELNRKIRGAYLNNQYWNGIYYNALGLLKFGKLRYFFGFLASVLGPRFVFYIRSKLNGDNAPIS